MSVFYGYCIEQPLYFKFGYIARDTTFVERCSLNTGHWAGINFGYHDCGLLIQVVSLRCRFHCDVFNLDSTPLPSHPLFYVPLSLLFSFPLPSPFSLPPLSPFPSFRPSPLLSLPPFSLPPPSPSPSLFSLPPLHFSLPPPSPSLPLLPPSPSPSLPPSLPPSSLPSLLRCYLKLRWTS